MSWGGPGFVIVIFALAYGGWLLNNWIRAKHGYDLEDEWGGKSAKSGESSQAMTEMKHALEAMETRMKTMEERTRVLERIVTDRGLTVADEIEALRSDRRAAASSQQEAL